MQVLKKNWPFLLIALVSIFLGILAVLTAIKLREEKPVAPTAPRSKPKAVEGVPEPQCTIGFTLSLATSPGPSVSPSPGTTPGASVSPATTPRASATPTPRASTSPDATPGTSVSPSPYATPTPGVSATPNPTSSVIPDVPKAGTSWPTLFLLMGAAILVIVGLALP